MVNLIKFAVSLLLVLYFVSDLDRPLIKVFLYLIIDVFYLIVKLVLTFVNGKRIDCVYTTVFKMSFTTFLLNS